MILLRKDFKGTWGHYLCSSRSDKCLFYSFELYIDLDDESKTVKLKTEWPYFFRNIGNAYKG